MSTHIGAKKGDIAKSVLMPGDPLRAKFIAENFLQSPKLYNEVRGMLGYTGTYKGVPVSVQGSGMGMPSMGIYSWELYTQFDVENIVRVGTAGSFHESVKVGDIVAGIAASTGSSYVESFDLPGAYAPNASWELLTKLKDAGEEANLPFVVGNIVSSDAFYDTNEDWWKKWAKMGVMAVEMEAAALYMNAAYHKKNALAIVTISDHFVTGESTDSKTRETKFTNMMELALEAVTR